MTKTSPVQLDPLDDHSEKKPAQPFTPLTPDNRIGIAIVGLGHLSLEAILPAFGQSRFAKPVALVSGDKRKAVKVAEQYGIREDAIYNYDNFDSIIDNEAIDAVYVVLPNNMHASFTKRAAAAGKHVICEKPMAKTLAEADEMIAACADAGKKLMIAYRIQYEPHHAKVREWIEKQQYGKVKVIEMFNSQNINHDDQWRLKKSLAGGGSLPDIGIYCLNTARYILGEEPVWVNASIYSDPSDPRFKEVEDVVLFQMQFPSGAMVNAGCSYSVHESRRYRVLTDKGGWFGMDPAFPYMGLKLEVNEIRNGQAWLSVPEIKEANQFASEIDHFAECILKDKLPKTGGDEGRRDMLIMEAIYKSAKEGRRIFLKD